MNKPDSATIRVYHNIDAAFLGYRPEQRVTPVFETEESAAEHEELCARMYELLNIGDDPSFGPPDPRAVEYRARRNRSLSVGDVIEIGRTGGDVADFYSVASCGFEPIATPRIVTLGSRGTTPLI